jgi:hypothetical protein
MQNLCKITDRRSNAAKIRYLKEDVSEKHLWKAVICQAIEDATSRSSKKRFVCVKQRAIKWLTEDNDDFKAVCDLAGYNHKTVKKNVLEMIKDT